MHWSFAYLLAASSLAACSPIADGGDEGIQYVKNVAPTGMACEFTAAASEPFLSQGMVNIVSPYYRMHPQLQSRVTADVGQEAQRTIFTRGARVDIEFPDQTVFTQAEQDEMRANNTTHFESPFTAPIAPNNGLTDASYLGIPTALFDRLLAKFPNARPGSAERFITTVIIKSVVYGVLSEDEVTSQEFQFPVTICNNCLLNVVGACPLPSGTELTNPGNPCNAYQDETVDCCVNANSQVICPAIVAL